MGARQSGRRQKTWSIQMENIKFEPGSVTKSQGCELQGTLGSMGSWLQLLPQHPEASAAGDGSSQNWSCQDLW